MRRPAFLPLAVCSALALGGAGCALRPARPTRHTLGPGNSGSTLAVRVGDALAVSLPANATTGYGWALARPQDLAPVLVVVGEDYAAAPTPSGQTGVGGTYHLRLRAEAPGTVRVRLGYRRPFEPTAPDAQTFAVTIAVR